MTAPACKPTRRMLRAFAGVYAGYLVAVLGLVAFMFYNHAWTQMAPLAAAFGASTTGFVALLARAGRAPGVRLPPARTRRLGLLMAAAGAALLLASVIAAILLLR